MDLFRFKQFVVNQEGVAMRVNTDGVLLGAWVNLAPHTATPKILDIGTGSGVIALMLAQRLASSNKVNSFRIDAIEPHLLSAQAAVTNFNNAPWGSCMRLFNSTLQDYTQGSQYDLIVSNPPYYHDSLRPPDDNRRFVRHADSLNQDDLLKGVAALLTPCGSFGVVLPFLQQKDFLIKASTVGLHLYRETIVYTASGRLPKRALMEFVQKEEPLQSDSIAIHDADGSYTEDYKQLTKDFYLAF